MRPPVVTAWHDAETLADAVAARLVTRLVTTQADRGHAGVVLTGGGVGIAALAALARSPSRDSLDWSALDVWWGDERFVPADDPQRNDEQARRALLDHVPVDPRRVHPMPAAGATSSDVHAAAAAYADELAAHAALEAHAPLPHLDVLLLGVGADGHVASLFPHSPALHDTRTPVKISVTTVVLNIGLSYLLMQFLGVGGLALGTTVALTVNFVVLVWLLERRIGPVGFGTIFSSLLRVIAVSAVMGVAVWAVDFLLSHAIGETLGGNAARVATGLVVGGLVFLGVARLVKMPELAEITDMLRAVLKRPTRGPSGPASGE